MRLHAAARPACVSIACLALFACGASEQEALPDVVRVPAPLACYPAQLRYTKFSPVSSCPGVEDQQELLPPPDLIFLVSKSGRVFDAYSVGDVPPEFDSCLLAVGQSLEFEAARTCGGEPVAAVVRVAYREVFIFPAQKADR
jgi:hypothetical protein